MPISSGVQACCAIFRSPSNQYLHPVLGSARGARTPAHTVVHAGPLTAQARSLWRSSCMEASDRKRDFPFARGSWRHRHPRGVEGELLSGPQSPPDPPPLSRPQEASRYCEPSHNQAVKHEPDYDIDWRANQCPRNHVACLPQPAAVSAVTPTKVG